MIQTTRRSLGSGLFGLWAVAGSFAVYHEVIHEGLQISTIIILIITGLLAGIRLARAWIGDFRSE